MNGRSASRVLLLSNNTLYLYDLRRDACVWRRTLTEVPEQIGWQSNTRALLQTRGKHQRIHWYRLDATHLTWRRCPAPPKTKRRFLTDLTDEGC